MPQKVLFITNVEHLEISTDLGRGEKVGDRFWITNNREVVTGLVSSVFRKVAGALEAAYLEKASAAAYSVEDAPDFADNSVALAFLRRRLADVHMFLHVLWLEKDNAANVDLGYLEHPYRGRPGSNISRNNFNHWNTTATGAVGPVIFSRDELRSARRQYASLAAEELVVGHQVATEPHSRFDRAFYFLQAARGAGDLGVKISNYCTAFEAIFATDTQELSHKLAERIAVFLETDKARRLELFRGVKKAYGFRSKTVHGVRGSPKFEKSVQAAAVLCDDVARRVFRRIIEDRALSGRFFSHKGEADMDDYFTRLVLTQER